MRAGWLVLGACSHAPIPATSATSARAPAAVVAQIERGKQLYAERCATCHGDRGQGVADHGPAIVGAAALPVEPPVGAKRNATFRTAADLVAWTAETMPSDEPASLPADDYWAIAAVIVATNGNALTTPLDARTAPTIYLRR